MDMTSLNMSKEKDDYISSPVLSQDSDMDFHKDVEMTGNNSMDINGEEEKHAELEKLQSTRSIAETFSFPHEVAFIIVICMAQLTTRKYSLL
jgi:hypothetical protein